MEKRELGTSGIYVSEIGLGCMSLPDDRAEAERIVNTAIEGGINFFDTADLYDGGTNEELIGDLLKEHREKIILATKVGNRLKLDHTSWHWDPSKDHIMQAVKESLRRLGTDYIDLYQLHGGTMEDDADEVIDAFETLKKEGVILQYGISSIRPNVIERFLTKSNAVSVMMQYSLLDRRPEEWFRMIQQHGASVIARGTLAKGLLTLEGEKRAARADGFSTYSGDELRETVEKLAAESEDLHADAISFNLSEETVASALVGASSEKQLLDSILAYEKHVDRTRIEGLKTVTKQDVYKDNRPG